MNKFEESVLEAELLVMPEEQQLGTVRNFLADRKILWDNRALDESGKFSPLDFIPGVSAVKAGASGGNFLRRNWGKVAVAGLAGIALAHSLVSGSSFEGNADLSAAHTAANVYKIEFDKNTAITPGTVYMKEDYTASDIEYKFKLHACFGLCHDFSSPSKINPRVNKLIKGGVGQEEIIVPLDAIKAFEDGDGIDIEVDKRQLIGHLAWAGAAPTVLNFTGEASNPNTGDQNGFRDQFFKLVGALPSIANLDGLQNAYTGLDQRVNHDVSMDALNGMADCNQEPSFEQMADKQVEDSVRKTVDVIPGTPDILNFSFTHPNAGIKVDTGQRADFVLGGTSGQSSYALGEKPERDLTLCAGDKLPVSQ